MNNNNCPACGSENTQRLEVACATNPNPVLLASAAPPQAKHIPGAGLAIGGGILIGLFGILLMVGGLGAGFVLLLIGALPATIAFISQREARQYNEKELPPLIEAWKRRWMCLKCGEVYEPRSMPDIRELNRA